MCGTSKKEYLEKIRWRYRHSGKRGKGKILDEFCEVCSYERKYAIKLLGRKKERVLKRSGPKPKYGPEVLVVLKAIWLAADQMCSKRLKAAWVLWLPYYERNHGALELQLREKLLALSRGTIDRLLKNQIPIRTDNWDIKTPGFMAMPIG